MTRSESCHFGDRGSNHDRRRVGCLVDLIWVVLYLLLQLVLRCANEELLRGGFCPDLPQTLLNKQFLNSTVLNHSRTTFN